MRTYSEPVARKRGMTKHSKPIPKSGVPERIFNGFRRILAPNPSPMTFHGTNTYLVGTRDIAVIDPGPPDETHLNAILGALTAEQRISHILVTHSHIDHSPLAMVLAQITGARIYAFGDSRAGRAPVMKHLTALEGGEGVDETFMPDVCLKDGDVVSGTNWELTALHTPGHMGNHLCFAWDRKGALFSGDLVMGWATSMVSPPDGHLTDFMASLERLKTRSGDKIYFPGHGDPIEDPSQRLDELLKHRRMRETQILEALRKSPATPHTLTKLIYADVPVELWPAAERNVLAHLIDLEFRGIVRANDEIGPKSRFEKI